MLHSGGSSRLTLADNPLYNGLVCLGLLWMATAVNILGLQHAKWLQNIGGISTLLSPRSCSAAA